MENKNHTLNVQPRRVAQTLFIMAIVITIFTFIGKYLTLFPNTFRPATAIGKYVLENYFILEFRLNTESNIVVYFTAFILLTLITLLFFMIALYKKSAKDAFKSSWFMFAAFFLCLSIYTTAALPEKHVKFYYTGWTDRNGWFEFRWAVLIIGILILAFLFRKFLMHFEGRFKILLAASIALFYTGMFGVELFSGRYASFYREQTLGLAIISAAAELMGFGGLILLIYMLLHYIEIYMPEIRFVTRSTEQLNKEYVQQVQPRRMIWVFVIAALIFGILSFIGQILRLFPDSYTIQSPLQESFLDIFIYQFGVNTEANMATHFNTLVLVVVAALFFVVALLKNSVKDKYRIGWFTLSLFVLYLSIDEQAVLHEKLNKVFSGWSNLNGWFEYKWLIPAIVGVIVLAVLFIPFFLHLEIKFKILFVVSALMYFAGAFGGEMFSGRYASINGVKNITYSFMTTIEELLELNGINLLIYSLLHYIEIYFSNIRLMFQSKKA